MNFKKNAPLWVGLAIPVAMILFIAASIYWPQRNVQQPQYNFVYMLHDYSDGYDYRVVNEHITRTPLSDTSPVKSGPDTKTVPSRFFTYDVPTNTSKELPFEEVTTLRVNNNVTSPDGYKITRGGQDGGVFPFFFSQGNYNEQYLVKGNHAVKLSNLEDTQPPYYASFESLGWVLP